MHTLPELEDNFLDKEARIDDIIEATTLIIDSEDEQLIQGKDNLIKLHEIGLIDTKKLSLELRKLVSTIIGTVDNGT